MMSARGLGYRAGNSFLDDLVSGQRRPGYVAIGSPIEALLPPRLCRRAEEQVAAERRHGRLENMKEL